jgi:glycosyltransferase involved in cell wall biosynthesis
VNRQLGAPLAFFLPSLAGGGAERAILNLATGFSERGVRTDLVLARAEGPYLALVPPTVRVIDLKASRVFRSFGSLAAYLRRERPRALLSALDHASVVAILAARTAGARTRVVISIQNTLGKEARDTISTKSILWLLRRLHHCADAIVAVSQGVAEDLVRTIDVPRGRVDVIYNPVITPTLMQVASERPSHSWFEDSTHPIVLGVGRLAPQKNFQLLIDAFALVKRDYEDARLVILGEGPERRLLEERVHDHRLEGSVALPGFVDNPYACMARANVFVLSSDFEGLPTVLVESLALGTPVVATDCQSGPREILRGGILGDLVPVGNVCAMARAIARALTDPRHAPPAEVLRPFTVDVVLDQLHRALRLDA